jgi:hypothetical protein
MNLVTIPNIITETRAPSNTDTTMMTEYSAAMISQGKQDRLSPTPHQVCNQAAKKSRPINKPSSAPQNQSVCH